MRTGRRNPHEMCGFHYPVTAPEQGYCRTIGQARPPKTL
jgi:hypothetical protein